MKLQSISCEGDYFLNADGSEFHYAGLTEFGQWKRFNMDNGPEALVRPLLTERRQVADNAGYTGPIVLRVFRYAHPNNPFGMLPIPADASKINGFLDMCAEYRMYVDWTTGDSQLILPIVADQQDSLTKFSNAIARFCFLETCNEPFKNGDLPRNGVKSEPSPFYLRDSGNYGEVTDTQRWESEFDLDYVSYHGTRTNDFGRWPKWVTDLDDQFASLRRATGHAVVLKEPAKFGVHYTDPAMAHELGLRTSMGGGILFHSQLGLESNGYDEATKAAAHEFFRGVQGALG